MEPFLARSPFPDAPRLLLRNAKPLAAGMDRWIFAHPGDPALIVKVRRLDRLSAQSWRKRLLCRFHRHGYWGRYLYEIYEHLAAAHHHGVTPPWMQKWRGFADTDLGPGLVYEAERQPDGSLAPTLGRLLREGCVDEAARRDLEIFLQQILESPVVVADLHPDNLVHSGGRFVLIDGIGDHNALPLRQWFPALNRRSKLKKCRRLWRACFPISAIAKAPVPLPHWPSYASAASRP